MVHFLPATLLVLLLVSCGVGHKEFSTPNIIYILADDLGYGETGVYGQQKIQTPHIDDLAANGMLFTQHYSGAPVCAPARYSLLTGQHMGHAYIRGNDEWAERGEVWNYLKATEDRRLEGQLPLPESTFTLGHMLQESGYRTGIVGKWGLGAPMTESIPTKMGFDFFYGYNCQRQAHQLYPPHLWKNETKVLLDNDVIPPGTKLPETADPYAEGSYQVYTQQDYAPALMHQEALNFIRASKDQPFFLYYASPLPHVPLQVPQEYVDKYVKLFGEKEPYNGNQGYFPHRYPRAAYAGMISYLDDQVGEIVAVLKELGEYENTLIIFSSDNGPTYAGGVDPEFFNSAGPFQDTYGRTKGFMYEGGIRVPMIAHWPARIKVGSKTAHISAFWDIMPTLAELAGAEIPKNTDGLSFVPALLGNSDQADHDHLYWEFPGYGGQQAVRIGNWKGIRKNIHKGNLTIELYNLENDPKEEVNVADQYPEIIKKMARLMATERTDPELESFRLNVPGEHDL
ncbi:arylsulfatase [Fulvivirga sp. M361]|nr:arylsulfatase [Fulvivirga sp. M361]